MTCEELRPEYTAWALGSSDDPERAEINEHLARNCPNCVPGVKNALSFVADLSGVVKVTEPPKRLRGRIVSMVQAEPKRSWSYGILPWIVSGALAVMLLALAIPGRRQSRDLTRLEQALAILNDASTREVSFGEPAKPARGRVFVNSTRGIVFLATNLPRIEAGKTFELWTIPAGGKPVPAGTFQSGADSTAVYVRQGQVGTPSAVAVSVEPEGGSPQPTTAPIIVASVTGG